jgi:hypothetical protein
MQHRSISYDLSIQKKVHFSKVHQHSHQGIALDDANYQSNPYCRHVGIIDSRKATNNSKGKGKVVHAMKMYWGGE